MKKDPVYKKFKSYQFEFVGEFKLSLDNFKSRKNPKPLKIEYDSLNSKYGKGVYIFVGYKENPVYIGHSINVSERLNQYLWEHPIRSGHQIDTTTDIHCKIYAYLKRGRAMRIYFSSQSNSRNVEKELIKEYYPDEWWNLSH